MKEVRLPKSKDMKSTGETQLKEKRLQKREASRKTEESKDQPTGITQTFECHLFPVTPIYGFHVTLDP